MPNFPRARFRNAGLTTLIGLIGLACGDDSNTAESILANTAGVPGAPPVTTAPAVAGATGSQPGAVSSGAGAPGVLPIQGAAGAMPVPAAGGAAAMGMAGNGTTAVGGMPATTGGVAGMGAGGMDDGAAGAVMGAAGSAAANDPFSFFVTSTNPTDAMGNPVGGNLGGLTGADAYCQQLAAAVGSQRSWAAYLSGEGQNARERIGSGPWFNINGAMVATDLANLHEEGSANGITGATALTENGDSIPGNEHDIMTGSMPNGMAFANLSCNDWSDSTGNFTTVVGHHNRTGLGDAALGLVAEGWNAAHETNGCSFTLLAQTGGAAQFYCFASD